MDCWEICIIYSISANGFSRCLTVRCREVCLEDRQQKGHWSYQFYKPLGIQSVFSWPSCKWVLCLQNPAAKVAGVGRRGLLLDTK